MAKYIDARNKECPLPVIMTKKALDSGENDITVAVSNKIAVENLTRLAQNSGFDANVSTLSDYFEVSFGVGANPVCKIDTSKDTAFFITRDVLGSGSDELGGNLMKMFLYTLSESDDIPKYVIFINAGVKLTTNDSLLPSLTELKNKGCEIFACGTCLNFYELSEAVKIGTVSNMYDIVEKLQSVSKVITI